MNLNLHKNARTTPAIRQELRESTQSERELAREYQLNRGTVRPWRRRDTGQDASHRPHRLHPTLTPAQALVVIELRKTLLLPLEMCIRDSPPTLVFRSNGASGSSRVKYLAGAGAV